MGFGLDIRGSFPMLGSILGGGSNKSLDRIQQWIETNVPGRLVRCWKEKSQGKIVLNCQVNPLAEPLFVTCTSLGKVHLNCKTSNVGTYYHMEVCEFVSRMGQDLKIRWEKPTNLENLLTPNVQDVAGTMLYNLSGICQVLKSERANGLDFIQLGMPAGEIFETGMAVNTILGPRDTDWIDRVAINPSTGYDVFPCADNASGAMDLGIALGLMWLEVIWQKPISERATQIQIETLERLDKAYTVNPQLQFPWKEWKELLDIAGDQYESKHQSVIEQNAAQQPVIGLPIGYRRFPMQKDFNWSWSITLPGSFEVLEDDTLILADENRAVQITSLSLSKDGQPLLPVHLLESDAFGPHDSRIVEQSDSDLKLGSFRPDEDDGELFFGAVAVPGETILCTITFKSSNEKDWAVETWKSIRRRKQE